MSPHLLFSGSGGPWALALLLLIALGLGGLLVPFIQQLRGKRPPGVLWLVPPALVALVGMLGTLAALGEVQAALEAASPDVRSLLAAKGIALSLQSLSVAGGGVALLGVFGAGGIGLASVIQPGPAPRLHVTSAVLGGVAAVALIGGGLVVAVLSARELGILAWLPPLVLFFTSLATALAALRTSEAEGWADSAPSRIAAAGTCALAALLGTALALWARGMTEAFNALTYASPDTRGLLWQAAAEVVHLGVTFAVGAGVAAALAAGGLALLHGARAFTGRNLVSAALMLLPLLVIAGSGAFAAIQVGALSERLLVPALSTPADPPSDVR